MSGTGKMIAIAKAFGATESAISQEVGRQLPGEVDSWLDEHITNPDSPPLDRSLTSSSSAAPADMVGGLKSQIQAKLDAPSTAGTSGQVLGLDGNLKPEWKTISGGGTVDSSLSTSSENPVQNKVITKVVNEIALNGKYQASSGGTVDTYYTLTQGLINNSAGTSISSIVISSNNTAYIFINREDVPDAIYFDTTKVKVNVSFFKNNKQMSNTYSSWITSSPMSYTAPNDYEVIGINVRKLSGNITTADLTTVLYKKVTNVSYFGNLATENYVANNIRKRMKCIYPNNFTSRIKPDIWFDGGYRADIDLESYKISGTGEAWVATDGNDSTGTGTEENPFATITKALTESAVTIHIKEGTYTQGTHYSDSCNFAGKNVIGHGTVVMQGDSDGHKPKVNASAYIENITFKHGNSTTNMAFEATCATSGQVVCFVGCTFRDGGTNGLGLTGIDAVVVNCVAYGNRYDGFNYHAKTIESTDYIPNVLEIDCVAYNNGSSESGMDSCNGSTAHDGAQIVRLNGEYYSCYGGVIAEIGGTGADDPTTKSVNFGVLAHDSTGVDSYKASFWASFNTEMYLYDCKSYGGSYDISAINTSKVVSWKLTTGSDNPSVNADNTATVIQH